MNNTDQKQKPTLEPDIFHNWADLYLPRMANRILLPIISRINFITPNAVSIFSFFIFVAGSALIFIKIPYHLYYTAILLPLAYMGDCLDGQLARKKNLTSEIGNYIDKVVDVLKTYVIFASLAYGAYIDTHNITYIFLGFTACFFFNFRYYIKMETIFSQCNLNPTYLIKCAERKIEILTKREIEYNELNKTFKGKIKLFWLKNRVVFLVDEEQFVVFTSIAALFNKIELALWIFAISQTCLAFWRLFQRGYQKHKTPEKLLDPMRK